MTLRTGDRVRYVGPDEDYECAAGSVTRTPQPEFATVDLDHNGGRVTFHRTHLEKLSGVRQDVDSGAAKHIARQADKKAAVEQYREQHRGIDPKYAPQVSRTLTRDGISTVYVAGPMRNYPRLNFPLLYEAAGIIEDLGFTAVNPAQLDVEHGVDKDNPDPTVADSDDFIRDAIFRDLRVVLYDADCVVVCPGSDDSDGVAVEKAGAKYAKKPVYTLREFIAKATAGEL